mmetsp:Transcript_24891/g.43755  ORF Transcript_24891/g.43755 Transcript_24891/m.43755 type:complete len:103 (-) Transcript_24891:32-340(-)
MGCCNPKKSEEDKYNITMQAQAALEKSVAFTDLSLTSQRQITVLNETKHKHKDSLRSSRSSIEASFLHIQDESLTPKFGQRVRARSRKRTEDHSADKENICK